MVITDTGMYQVLGGRVRHFLVTTEATHNTECLQVFL